MDIQQIKELAEILKANDLELLELNQEGLSIKLRRACAPVRAEDSPPPSPGAPAPHQEAKAPGRELLSPIVGVFYRATAPGARPYVDVGDTVKKGDVLCIVEAMKMMNEITAEWDGRIAEILASDGNLVEFGQPLFRIV